MICYAIKNTKYGGYLRKQNSPFKLFEPEFYKTINEDTIITQYPNDLETFIKIHNMEDSKVVKVEIREVEDV